MTISLVSDPSGTSGKIQVAGSDIITFNSGGIISGYGDASIGQAKLSEGLTVALEQASTAGSAISWPPIPTWVRRITLSYSDLSVSSTGIPMVCIGTGGIPETTGYKGTAFGATATYINHSNGINLVGAVSAATIMHGSMVITRVSDVSNTWAFNGICGFSNTNAMGYSAGSKSLAGPLDKIEILVTAGTFDGGVMNIMYE